MKVLHIIGGGDIGGAKHHVLSLVKELSKYIDVKLISLRPGAFADEALALGINVEVIKTWSIFGDIKRIITIVKDEKYEIIHCHGAKANLVSVFAKLFLSTPTLTTVHSDYRLDYIHNVFKQYSFGLINAFALRLIKYYIGVSNNFKQMLITRGFDPNKIYTVYNGIDFEQETKSYSRKEFSKKFHVSLRDTDIVVGILARLHPVKDLNTFIDAAKQVSVKLPFVKFVIGGEGDERKALQHKIHSLGLSNHVFIVGWIQDPYEFMSILDINVMTSISESFPYTLLEGVKLKKASISTDVGGISDLIEHGKNGFLFEPGDKQKLAEYIIQLVNDPNLRRTLGERIYQKARSEFSLKNMCQTQLSIYSSIMHADAQRKAIAKKGYHMIISGYYGFQNVGDDAMLAAMIDSFRSLKKDIRIAVLSSNPMETKKIYHVDSIGRLNIFQILQAMRKSRLFINGGGSLIQDSTSTRSLYYYLGLIWFAKKLGMKVMLYANGIGPLNKRSNRKLAHKILNKVDVITLREQLSAKELQHIHVDRPKSYVTADPAVSMEPAGKEVVERILMDESIEPSAPFVGFSIRKWGEHEKYEKVIADIADYMITQYGLTPLFIPMHYPGDLPIIESIVSKMKGKGYIIKNKYSVPEILGIIGRTRMLIGMRLHALIFAASLKIPVVGLVYESKVEGFIQYIGQPSAGNVNSLEYSGLKQIVDDVWNNKEKIELHLETISSELKEKAFLNAQTAIHLLDE